MIYYFYVVTIQKENGNENEQQDPNESSFWNDRKSVSFRK
jgi:hypothetical protein